MICKFERSTPMSLKAGFCKLSIVPDFPVSLSGYGGESQRFCEEVAEPIYLTCISVANDEKTILLFTFDTCGLLLAHIQEMREMITAETGIPAENIFFGATHCHNGASMYPTGMPQAIQYNQFVFPIAVEAAKGAIADLAPATLSANCPEIQGMNFTRHYIGIDGNKYSANMAFPKEMTMVDHNTLCDRRMALARFTREGKKDIVIINWQAHPDSAYAIGFKKMCPSWIGRLRDKTESLTDTLVAYFTGTAGNQTTDSRLPDRKHGLQWFEYGEKMGEIAAEQLKYLKPVEGDEIVTARELFDAPVNHSQDDLYEVAGEILDLFQKGEKEKGAELLAKHHLANTSHANALRTRAKMAESIGLELNAFRIGTVGFVTNTCETFGNQGIFVKDHSPFDTTFFFTGNRSYIACEDAFNYFAYEAYGNSAYYAQGAAEKMADKLVEMLRSVQ